jgi:hypothetical protein
VATMEHLDEWYKTITDHITSSGLRNLSEYERGGSKVFGNFTNITRSKTLRKLFSYSDFKHADDFNFLSQDLIYAIAVLELLSPHINNVLKEGGTYDQTREDHLYLRYANYALQTVYSFWDRVGDFLDFFFDTKQKGDVYMSRVLKQFPEELKGDTYKKLTDLYNSKVLPVIEERHLSVHQFTLKAKYYWGVIEHGGKDMAKVEELQHEKDAYPKIFRDQLEYMFEGFSLMLALVSELPDKKEEEVKAATE